MRGMSKRGGVSMRRRVLAMLLFLLVELEVCACSGGEEPVYTKAGYTVDTEAQTITKGEDVYTYSIKTGTNLVEITITYPNGAQYVWTSGASGGHGALYAGLTEDTGQYPDGSTLVRLLPTFEPQRNSLGFSIFCSILLAGVGIFNLVSPRTAWYLSYGWRFRDAEPSEAALLLGRAGGGFLIFLALVLPFVMD